MVILHIGTHKTASTFLQYNYFPAINNVRYFHGELAVSELLKSNCTLTEDILLSNEGFSGVAWNALWKAGVPNEFHWIKSFETRISNLHRLFPEAHVIIFFRRHGDLLISMYKQYVQEGGILKFDEFYNETGVIREQDLNYAERINKLRSLFKNVHIFSYEDFRKQGEKLLDSFFKNELNLDRDAGLGVGEKFSNKSITGSKVEILRKTNKVYNKFPSVIRKALSYIKSSPRDILQNALSFWEPKDPEYFKKNRDEINRLMKDDWLYVEATKTSY